MLIYVVFHDNNNYFSIAYRYGDLRIVGGGDSGQLQFYSIDGYWGAICGYGFDDNAGDVACRQLGYEQAEDVYTEYINVNISLFLVASYVS